MAQALSVAQKAVSLEPSELHGRTQLATLSLQQGDSNAAQALLVASTEEHDLGESREALSLHSIALAHKDGHRAEAALQLAQKAVILTPWQKNNWESLAYVRSRIS